LCFSLFDKSESLGEAFIKTGSISKENGFTDQNTLPENIYLTGQKKFIMF